MVFFLFQIHFHSLLNDNTCSPWPSVCTQMFSKGLCESMCGFSKWLNKTYFLSQVSSIQSTDAEGKVTIKWCIVASVRSIRSPSPSDGCATFRSAHTHCKHSVTWPCCHSWKGNVVGVSIHSKLLHLPVLSSRSYHKECIKLRSLTPTYVSTHAVQIYLQLFNFFWYLTTSCFHLSFTYWLLGEITGYILNTEFLLKIYLFDSLYRPHLTFSFLVLTIWTYFTDSDIWG